MKKGFTLMEMLAVVLVIAIVVSMAAPAYRNVRHQMKNNQAQAATKKLAEAVRTYYQESRGYIITGCFTPTSDTIIKTTTCENAPGATGIPSSSVTVPPAVSSLFGCGYLSFKDFQNLPYTFCTYSSSFPATLGTAPDHAVAPIYAYSYGVTGAGDKFIKSAENAGYIFVDSTMKVKDTYK